MQTTSIPKLSIQSTSLDVISDVESNKIAHDSFWISWDDISNDIEVYKVNVDTLELRSTGAIDVTKRANRQLSVVYEQNKSAIIEFPSKKLSNFQSSQPLSRVRSDITTIDISPGGDLLLVGTARGELDVLSIKDRGTIVRTLKGHLLHTTKAKFFPSGQAAVSAGSDFQIKIWNVVDGSNPRTLVGHKDQIIDLGVIERGRNIVSGSEDSTVKLWECGSGQNISTFRAQSKVKALTILSSSSQPSKNEESDLKFGVDGKTVAIALESENFVTSWDLRTESASFKIPTNSPISAISSQGDHILLTGSTTGQLSVWDTRAASTPLSSLQLPSNPEINSLLTTPESIILSTYGETDAIKLNLSSPDNFDLSAFSAVYLSGGTEPITSIAADHHHSTIYLAGKHSTIWAY